MGHVVSERSHECWCWPIYRGSIKKEDRDVHWLLLSRETSVSAHSLCHVIRGHNGGVISRSREGAIYRGVIGALTSAVNGTKCRNVFCMRCSMRLTACFIQI